jgi:hypothetical protein
MGVDRASFDDLVTLVTAPTGPTARRRADPARARPERRRPEQILWRWRASARATRKIRTAARAPSTEAAAPRCAGELGGHRHEENAAKLVNTACDFADRGRQRSRLRGLHPGPPVSSTRHGRAWNRRGGRRCARRELRSPSSRLPTPRTPQKKGARASSRPRTRTACRKPAKMASRRSVPATARLRRVVRRFAIFPEKSRELCQRLARGMSFIELGPPAASGSSTCLVSSRRRPRASPARHSPPRLSRSSSTSILT